MLYPLAGFGQMPMPQRKLRLKSTSVEQHRFVMRLKPERRHQIDNFKRFFVLPCECHILASMTALFKKQFRLDACGCVANGSRSFSAAIKSLRW